VEKIKMEKHVGTARTRIDCESKHQT